jgi:hypothetical protein
VHALLWFLHARYRFSRSYIRNPHALAKYDLLAVALIAPRYTGMGDNKEQIEEREKESDVDREWSKRAAGAAAKIKQSSNRPSAARIPI